MAGEAKEKLDGGGYKEYQEKERLGLGNNRKKREAMREEKGRDERQRRNRIAKGWNKIKGLGRKGGLATARCTVKKERDDRRGGWTDRKRIEIGREGSRWKKETQKRNPLRMGLARRREEDALERGKGKQGARAQPVRRRQLVYILGSTTTALVSSNPEVPGVARWPRRRDPLVGPRGRGGAKGVADGGGSDAERRMQGGGGAEGERRGGVERNRPARASSVSSPGVEELLAACLLPSFAIVSFLSVLVHSSVPID